VSSSNAMIMPGLPPGGFVSASRIKLDAKQLATAKEGDSVLPVRPTFLPNTGIEPLDSTAQRVNTVATYAPEAVSKTSSATFRGGLYGGLCGLIIGLASQGVGIVGDLFARRLPGGAIVVLLFTGFGSLLGSLLGFSKSGKSSAKELQTLLFMGQPPSGTHSA
jgi:hypothetical protein